MPLQAVFFDDNGQSGNAISFIVSVTGSCTSCQGFVSSTTRCLWDNSLTMAEAVWCVLAESLGHLLFHIIFWWSCSMKSPKLELYCFVSSRLQYNALTEIPNLLLFPLQGFRLRNSWESYVLSAPTSSAGNYSLNIYDRQASCTYCGCEHVHQKCVSAKHIWS